MSFRPQQNFELRMSNCEFRIAFRNQIRNSQFDIRNSSCSGRDSNSDHALIWCLQGISLPLCQLSYRSEPIANFELRIWDLRFQIRNSKFDIRNLFLVRP